jgi:digeranylgeranylglycerophospholipid reductase
MENHDVVIIGAGISGLYLSKLLEEKGIDFITLEKRNELGTYGPRIISIETLEKLNLPKNKLIKPIKELNFFSPKDIKISKIDKNIRGYVVNLKDIEYSIFNSIKDKNKIKLNKNVVDFNLDKKSIKLIDGQIIYFKILIFATGVLGVKFRNKLGINHPKNVFCYATEIKATDIITTILDNELAPGFYGWIIPLENGKIEIGYGAEELNIRDKKEIEKKLYSLAHLKKYKQNKILRYNGGFIPTDMTDKTSNKNWIIIGDASGGEPMLGGSIHKCIDESQLASKIIQKYLIGKLNTLEIYSKEWQKLLGNEFNSQKKIRQILDNAKNDDFDEAFRNLQGKEINGNGLINDLFRNIISNLKQ